MHTWGKVFTVATALAAVAALMLSSKMLQVHGSWLGKVEGLEKSNRDNAETIENDERELRALQANLHVTLIDWDKYWPGVPIDVNPQGGVITSRNFGKNFGYVGLPGIDRPIVHAFQLGSNGAQYMGPFQPPQPGDLDTNQVRLQQVGKSRPGDMPAWKSGNWRFRTRIPGRFRSIFNDLNTKLSEDDERLKLVQAKEADQDTNNQAAQQQLATRIQELIGDPADPASTGLVGAMETEEELRNQALAVVDRLRRQIKAANEDLNRLVETNNKLAGSLGKKATTAVSTTSK